MSAPLHEVETTIRRVPGVADASVQRVEGTGRARLRIRLEKDADIEVVARTIAARLRQQFGMNLDPATLREAARRTEQAPAPAAAGRPPRAPRPAFRSLRLEDRSLTVEVEVVLDLFGIEVQGHATAAAARRATHRAIARATLAAVEDLVAGRARIEVEEVTVTRSPDGDHATVIVTLVTETGMERLIGVSEVREDDDDQAVVRATLDAVNRRIEALLDDDGDVI